MASLKKPMADALKNSQKSSHIVLMQSNLQKDVILAGPAIQGYRKYSSSCLFSDMVSPFSKDPESICSAHIAHTRDSSATRLVKSGLPAPF